MSRVRRAGVNGGDGLDSALGLGTSSRPWIRALNYAVWAIIIVVFAGPLVAVVAGAFSGSRDPSQLSIIPADPSLASFSAAFDRGVLRYLANSLIVVGFGLVFQMIVSVFAAHALARKRFRGSAIAMLLVLSTMMLPEEILAIPLSQVLADVPFLGFNLINTLPGMIVPIVAWGFSILVMTEFMKEVPAELEEAAKIDGAGEIRTFLFVVLPTCTPALGVIGVFGFNMIWDQYLLPLLVASDSSMFTLPLALRTLRADPEVGLGVVLVAATLALLPAVIAFLCFQRSFMRGLSSGAVKG
ncbi:carbohydrate ABC transporter permease [Phytoactinopolyspora halotolerans]|uniref:Carbohydrate ABC transporter permease n=1 Tax=Phytoactinopolyspora halotolerans TaxID=1981512 RepID=A0A6L9S965_9ACTN|nr:carbohydrate ABC transporter permease [Phytoactinopolyspora halotolerans]NEE01231.1 carbohydrate ABC transporter permease [Phytoactinopolyspora halotolerans]